MQVSVLSSARHTHDFHARTGAVPVLQSTLTCPHCARASVEVMPTDACLFFWECPGCKAQLKPLAGDCCVFCSYGSVKCPLKQMEKGCC